MELTEDQTNEKHAKQCKHCSRNSLLPNEYECICISFWYNVLNQKQELTQFQRKKINFINRLKFAEHALICICIDVYTVYEGDNYDEIYKVLLTLKSQNLKFNNILIEKYKDLDKNLDFEPN